MIKEDRRQEVTRFFGRLVFAWIVETIAHHLDPRWRTRRSVRRAMRRYQEAIIAVQEAQQELVGAAARVAEEASRVEEG